MSYIVVDRVSKEYEIFKREKGFKHALASLVRRNYEVKRAVSDISFEIQKGELVGYIGQNGAGKSTTIKMLAGILIPTSGTVTVNGRVPHKYRKENAYDIGVVFGQRSQLFWNLPMEETFDLYKKIYKIDSHTFKRNVAFYVELLDMHEFLRTPVRQLSLGQRMRAELVVSLLHDPSILYLDEPTIGLDILVKKKIRHFIKEVNREKQTTVILTTHDMDDIEQICNRIIAIDRGGIVYDGSVDHFKEQYSSGHLIVVDFCEERVRIDDPRMEVVKEEGSKQWILLHRGEISVAEAISTITRRHEIQDIQIKEPRIEDAIREIYERG